MEEENKEENKSDEGLGDLIIEVEPGDEVLEKSPKSEEKKEPPKEEEKSEDTFGKRAEKRIRGLVSDRKRLETRLTELEKTAKERDEELAALNTRNTSYEATNLQEVEARVNAQIIAAQNDYKTAREADDYDKEAEALGRISQAQAQLLAVNARKRQIESQPKSKEKGKEEEKELEVPVIPEPDDRTLEWVDENPWIKSLDDPTAESEDKAMARLAQRLHKYATEVEQLSPVDDADEYWAAIDAGMRKKFPQRFEEDTEKKADTGNKKKQVTGGARQPAGNKKRTVKISQKQLAFAKKYKIDPKKLAAEQAIIDARSEG